MEVETISPQIPCSLHPSETIQRVSMDKNVNHHVYCLECIVQQKSNPTEAPKTLIPLSELIDTAASLYAKKRENINFEDQIPSEMSALLSNQAEKLEALTQHIEQEKKKVSEVFDSLSQELLQIIEEKKAEVFDTLDQQISNLGLWYVSFSQQLQKTYPTPQDIPNLYPTREGLNTKLGKITNATQLSALVKNLKDDLNETISNDSHKISAIHTMSKHLREVTELRSSYQTEDLDLTKLKLALRGQISDLMKKTWNLQNSIPEVVTGLTEESAFLKAQDFGLIKSWLPQNITFSPQLLYKELAEMVWMLQVSTDFVMGGKILSHLSSGTLSLKKVNILGGYLDKSWHSTVDFGTAGWIQSNDSFIFSLTKGIKCPQGKKGAQYAAYGNPNQGPCFGHGHDLSVWHAGTVSCVSPTSYEKSNELVDSSIVMKGKNPMAFIDVLDVEVYSVN